MKAIEILLSQFESFVQRAMIPSVSFVFVFLMVGVGTITFLKPSVLAFNCDIKTIIEIGSDIWWVALILLIGFSFFLSILHQVLFDNKLKNNFDKLCEDDTTSLLSKYRKQVIQKIRDEDKNNVFKSLKDEEFTDNNLYQIVGRKLAYLKVQTTTSRYVDDVKSIGMFFISLILSIIFWCSILDDSTNNSFVTGMFLSFGIWVYGFFIIRAKYHSRAIRLYVNYLLGEKKAETNKETIIKYVNR